MRDLKLQKDFWHLTEAVLAEKTANLKNLNVPVSEDPVFAVLIGMTTQEAKDHLSNNDIQYKGVRIQSLRTCEVDGQPQMMTMDYRVERVNVATTAGVITKVVSVA